MTNTSFRGGPIPRCSYHNRDLMRCAVSAVPDPNQATRFVLACPDCEEARRQAPLLMDSRGRPVSGYFFGTAEIEITREEFDALPANPAPFEVTPAGERRAIDMEAIS